MVVFVNRLDCIRTYRLLDFVARCSHRFVNRLFRTYLLGSHNTIMVVSPVDTSISPLSLFFPSRYLSLLLKIKRTYPNGVGNLSPNFVIILEQRERTSLRDEDFAARGFHRSPAKIFPRYCALRNRKTPRRPLFRLQKSYLWFSL